MLTGGRQEAAGPAAAAGLAIAALTPDVLSGAG
jgi:hypothetical protein